MKKLLVQQVVFLLGIEREVPNARLHQILEKMRAERDVGNIFPASPRDLDQQRVDVQVDERDLGLREELVDVFELGVAAVEEGHLDPAPLVEFEESLKVRKIWKTSIGDGMGKQGISMGPKFSSGVLFAADYEGMLIAVDAENGKKNWELKTEQPLVKLVSRGEFSGRNLIEALMRDAGADVDGVRVRFEPGMCRQIVQNTAPSVALPPVRRKTEVIRAGS